MTQLLKHYLINRDTGKYALTIPSGYMNVSLEGLQVVHRLFTENDVPYCLSTCLDTLEYSITIPEEQLAEYQNNSDITIISSIQREVELTIKEEVTTEIVYDLIYTKPHIVPETEDEGMKVITQEEWDNEIAIFDNRQREKRYDILRKYRDSMLEITDWMVTRSMEQEEPLSLDFKTWRKELRNLPNNNEFPSGFPTLPSELQSHIEIQELYSKFDEVRSIFMINDPLLIE